jgi:hypothetical protein
MTSFFYIISGIIMVLFAIDLLPGLAAVFAGCMGLCLALSGFTGMVEAVTKIMIHLKTAAIHPDPHDGPS